MILQAGAYRAVEYMPGEEAYRACRLLDRLGAPYAAYAADAILLAGAWEAGNFYEAHFSRCGPRFRHKPVYCRDSADFGGREIADLLLPGVPSEAAEALRALAGRMEGVRLVSSSGSCVDLCGAGVSKGAAPAGILPPGGVFPRGDPRAGGRGKRPFHAGNLRASLRAGGLGDLGQAAGRARDRARGPGPARVRAQGPLPGGARAF